MVEVINIGIVVEAQVGLIASLLEKVYNPFLLFRCEHPLAAVVTIIGAVPAQIVFNGIAKAGFVFRLHVLENGVEAPGHVLRLVCLEEAASLFVPVHRRIDGKSPVGFFWLVLSGHIAQAFASSRTVVEKAELIACRHLAIVEDNFFLFSPVYILIRLFNVYDCISVVSCCKNSDYFF